MRVDTDQSLADACRSGDRRAWRVLFERYHPRVFRLAYRFSGSADDAADLAQEAFLRIFRHIGGFRHECSLSTWIYRIVLNVCVNSHRSSRRNRPLCSLEAMPEEPPDPGESPCSMAEAGEFQRQVEIAVRALPPLLEEAFLLVVMEELPYPEAAAVLGLTVPALRMRVSRARQQLRNTLEPWLDAPSREAELPGNRASTRKGEL